MAELNKTATNLESIMNKWFKLPILLSTGPFVLLTFVVIVFPLLMASFVYVVLASAGFFGGGDPDKVPMSYAFSVVEAYMDWIDNL